MRTVHVWITKLGDWLGRRNDGDFNAEILEHLRLLTERHVRQGMSQEDAESAARRQFGNAALLSETRRDMQTIPALEAIWRDGRHAARSLARTPGLAISIILILALGIGANSAVFAAEIASSVRPTFRRVMVR